LLLYEVGSRLGTLSYLATARQSVSVDRVLQRLQNLAELMISDGEQRGIWAGPPLPGWQLLCGGALLAMGILCFLAPLDAARPSLGRWRRSLALSAAVLTVLLLASGLGVVPHHLVAVLPLALAALAPWTSELPRRSRSALAPAAALIAGFAALCFSWDLRIDRGLRTTQGKAFWSSAIGELGRDLTSRPAGAPRPKILSWGLRNNLYIVSG